MDYTIQSPFSNEIASKKKLINSQNANMRINSVHSSPYLQKFEISEKKIERLQMK